MKLKEAREFVTRFNAGASTPEETAAFLRWLTSTRAEELNVIADAHEAMYGSWALGGGPSDEWVLQLERKLDRSVVQPEGAVDEPVEEDFGSQVIAIRTRKKGWRRWAVAASVAILVGAAWYWVGPQLMKRPGVVEIHEKVLSMAVSNPLGNNQRAFVLPDGSKVLLKAGSILKYPPRFAGGDRLVELSGDAFFDVKESANSPFRVRIRNAELEVLGTYFEVMAYEDEPESRTTLITGSLRVTSGQESTVLRPGDQAEITYPSPGVGAGLRVRSNADIKTVLDWRDGDYDVHGIDLRTVLRVVARRYNLTVQYKPNVPDPPFNVIFNFHQNLDSIVEQLNSGVVKNIHFGANGKTLTVTAN